MVFVLVVGLQPGPKIWERRFGSIHIVHLQNGLIIMRAFRYTSCTFVSFSSKGQLWCFNGGNFSSLCFYPLDCLLLLVVDDSLFLEVFHLRHMH